MNLPMSLEDLRAAVASRYTSLHRIATGGQATVFKATSVGDGQIVALKVYHSGQGEERTQREMKALAAINCPTIVRLTDSHNLVIGEGKYSYIATQFIEGEPLNDVLARGPLSLREVSAMGRDVALAIDALWQHRLVHRDIKPANLMRQADGKVVVIDLGIARHMQLSSITTAGVAWGTQGYMSPEQMRAQRALTCKSDIFALGIVLQEAMSGNHPTASRQEFLSFGGLPTASLRRNIDPTFGKLVDRMVQFRSVLRPNPIEVVTTLKTVASGGP